MHPKVYEEFERVCAERKVVGSVLEVGAMPSPSSLLCLRALEHATEKVGIDLSGPHEFRDFKILQGNANTLDCFDDERFDAVLCNATLEHDKYFWKTIDSIKRVTRPGGQIILGVPGYDRIGVERFEAALGKVPGVRRLKQHRYFNLMFVSTLTFQVHNQPGDYYRYSPQAMREVFLEGCDDIDVRSIMLPPRVIGAGTKRI